MSGDRSARMSRLTLWSRSAAVAVAAIVVVSGCSSGPRHAASDGTRRVATETTGLDPTVPADPTSPSTSVAVDPPATTTTLLAHRVTYCWLSNTPLAAVTWTNAAGRLEVTHPQKLQGCKDMGTFRAGHAVLMSVRPADVTGLVVGYCDIKIDGMIKDHSDGLVVKLGLKMYSCAAPLG